MLLARSAHDWPSAGEWAPYEVEGDQTAIVSCPECGHRQSIEVYVIGPLGHVTPGIRCNDGCGWYEVAPQLQGWKPN